MRPQRTLLGIVIVAVVVFQRIALPFGHGQIPIVLPVVVVATLWAFWRGAVEQSPLALQLYLVAILACLAAATVHSWTGGGWSPLSMTYLVLTYLPLTFRFHNPSSDLFREALEFFVRVMAVVAGIGILQMFAQLGEWSYADPLGVLPSQLLLRGYNTSYPIAYGSDIFKSNGLVLLEPSFFSQFVALALVASLYLGKSRRWPLLFVCGLVVAVSGTGVVVAAAGTILLAMAHQGRHIRQVALVATAAGLIVLSPAGHLFTSRINEFSSSTSSGNGRFISPYRLAASTIASGPGVMLAGEGPGRVERLTAEVKATSGVAVVFPVVPKLAIEYGLPATAVFLCFMLVIALRAPPSRALAIVLLIMYLMLSGSLLQPSTVYAMWLFTGLFAVDRAARGVDSEADEAGATMSRRLARVSG